MTVAVIVAVVTYIPNSIIISVLLILVARLEPRYSLHYNHYRFHTPLPGSQTMGCNCLNHTRLVWRGSYPHNPDTRLHQYQYHSAGSSHSHCTDQCYNLPLPPPCRLHAAQPLISTCCYLYDTCPGLHIALIVIINSHRHHRAVCL